MTALHFPVLVESFPVKLWYSVLPSFHLPSPLLPLKPAGERKGQVVSWERTFLPIYSHRVRLSTWIKTKWTSTNISYSLISWAAYSPHHLLYKAL